MMFAVAGAIRRRLARSASSICPGSPVFLFVVEARRDWILRKRLQGERRDEFRRILRHHDENIVALFHEQAGELGGFVGGDGTGDAEHDAFRDFVSLSDFGFAGIGVRSGQSKPSAQITFRAHDVAKLLQILFHRFADDRVAIVAPKFHLARGVDDAQFDLLRRFPFRAWSGGAAIHPDRAA